MAHNPIIRRYRRVKPMNKKRIFAVFTAFTLCLPYVIPVYGAGVKSAVEAEADQNTIYISSSTDLKKLAEDCALDSWSRGKTIVLENDISLKGMKFEPIPSFSGTFDGNGFTIYGLDMAENISPAGLFGVVERGGVVKNLTVKGTVVLSENDSVGGGILGRNNGTVQSCSFVGDISGTNSSGGIVGVNEVSGLISNCSFDGTIYGKKQIGGIAGENYGTVLNCVNNGKVNTTFSESKITLDDMDITDLGLILNRNIIDISDIGGIVGLSTGIVQGCKNYGEIGYTHVGYNVGGIVGRQSGYLSGCTNDGHVYGRKDVGGIAGQLEPYSSWLTNSALEEVRSELNVLEGLVNDAIDDSTKQSAAITAQLTSLNNSVRDAKGIASNLADQAETVINDDVDVANTLLTRVSETLNDMISVVDPLAEAVSYAQDAVENINDFLDDASDLEDDMDKVAKASSAFKKSLVRVQNALMMLIGKFQAAMAALGDPDAESVAITDIYDALTELSDALYELSETASDLESYAEDADGTDPNAAALIAAFQAIIGSSADLAKIIQFIQANMGDIQQFEQLLLALLASGTELVSAMDRFIQGINGLSFYYLEDAGENAEKGLDSLSESTSNLKKLIHKLAKYEELSLTGVTSDMMETRNQLSDSLDNILDSVDILNELVYSASTELIGDMQLISNQMFKVFSLLIDSIEDLTYVKDDIEDYIEDVSDKAATSTQGAVADCINLGIVEGDINTGGITGYISFEYTFDLEDDIEMPQKITTDLKYMVSAVVRNCTNLGSITSRKNCAGGIAGAMKFGYVYNCGSAGDVTSTSGDYVGGIAGQSEGTIGLCSSRAVLSGGKYIGGIAGRGKTILNCYSVVNIEDYTQYASSIAADTTDDASIKDNYFVSDKFAGINRVSYAGKAMPVTYEELLAMPGILPIMNKFTAIFKCEDKVLKTIEFNYGDTITEDMFPAVPEKEGYYYEWSVKSFENLTHNVIANADYIRLDTTLASLQTRDGGQSVILVDGKFPAGSLMSASSITEGIKDKEEGWQIAFPDDGCPNHKIHYIAPAGTGKTSIYVLEDDKWVYIDTDTFGKYITFYASGNNITFKAVNSNMGAVNAEALVIIIITAAAAVIIIIKVKKKPSDKLKRIKNDKA